MRDGPIGFVGGIPIKTIGLVGGMTWESTLEYYRWINEGVRDRLGGLHSAEIVMHSVDFAQLNELQLAEQWPKVAGILSDAARRVEAAGADFVMLCSNTAHVVAEEVARAIRVPLVHIGDATAKAAALQGMKRVGLLGTRFTMERDFYRQRLEERGLTALVPDAEGRQAVHDIIFDELCRGIVCDSARDALRGVMARLVKQGAEGIILGCTELPLLVRRGDAPVPILDTTRLHAMKAVEMAVE